MKIWSMLQVLSQENEKRKQKLRIMEDVQYLWDGGTFADFPGGFQGLKKKRRVTKGVFLLPGMESRILTRSRVYYLPPPPLYDVITLPSLLVLLWIWLKAATIWTSSSPSHTPGIRMISLSFKAHESRECAHRTCDQPLGGGGVHPAPDFEYVSEVVKVEKKKVERSPEDRTGMCNKSYSNSADWMPFWGFLGVLILWCNSLQDILYCTYRTDDPLHGCGVLCTVLQSPWLCFIPGKDGACNHPSSAFWGLSHGLQPPSSISFNLLSPITRSKVILSLPVQNELCSLPALCDYSGGKVKSKREKS